MVYKYHRECKSCGKEFATNYHNKLYCGSNKCEIERISLKNKESHKKRDKDYLISKGRAYYRTNKEAQNLKKSQKYRKGKPFAKEYVKGKTIKHDVKYVSDYVERYGYTLITKNYKNNRSKITLSCSKGHKWETTFHNFKDNGNRCNVCYVDGNCTSSFETDVRKVLNKVYKGKVEHNNRSIIINPKTERYLELDLYMPDIKKAIECNGEYWHSSSYSIYKDRVKVKTCKRKGIELMVVTDAKWNAMNDNERTTMLKKFIGKQL